MGKTAWLTRPYFKVPEGQAADYRGYAQFKDDQTNGFVDLAFKNGWNAFTADIVPLLVGTLIAGILTVLTLGILAGPLAAGLYSMVVGRILQGCAVRMRERLGDLGPAEYHARHGPFEVERQYVRPAGLDWDEAAYRGDAYGCYGYACDVVEVAIDTDTYEGPGPRRRAAQGHISGCKASCHLVFYSNTVLYKCNQEHYVCHLTVVEVCTNGPGLSFSQSVNGC